MTNLVPFSNTMTSREIAELTDKRHDHVLRDIDNLLKTLSPDLGSGFSVAYEGNPAHGYRYFILDRDSTYCLVAGYDATARMKIIKRWQALEAAAATPEFQLEPPPSRPRRPVPDAPQIQALKLSRLAVQAAKAFGFKGNQASLSADQAIRAITGTSPLALMGQTHLAADSRGQTYGLNELGQMMDPPQSGHALGRLLSQHGLREKDETGNWVPTKAAEGLFEWLDTAKRHNGGTPVKQAKWFRSVLDRLNGGSV